VNIRSFFYLYGLLVAGPARAARLLIRDMRNVSPHSLRISVGSPEQNDRLIRSIP
jgi:histidinol-phosphate/aromatic aminotransferase/cobyric acid decarboxylase-like protein